MRKLFAVVVGIVCFAQASLRSQDAPKAEVFGGYSWLNIDTNGLSSRQNANGWVGAVSGNFNRWFGVEFDGSGYYKSYNVTVLTPEGLLSGSVKVSDYSYLAGPRVSYGPVFVHALMGGDHLSASASGYSASQDGLAGAFGGGAEIPFSRHLAFRAGADYVFSRHNIFGGSSETQNNVRAMAGIVYRFGESARRTRKAVWRAPSQRTPSQPPADDASPQAVSEAPLLGVVGHETSDGFKVTLVRGGTPADKGLIKPGDVLTKIDSTVVKSALDIENAVSQSASGSVRVLGLTQTTMGLVIIDRQVKVR